MWSWAPQTLATLVSLRCCDAIVTTRKESKLLEKNTPDGTSVKLSPWISQTSLCSWSLWKFLDNMDGERQRLK